MTVCNDSRGLLVVPICKLPFLWIVIEEYTGLAAGDTVASEVGAEALACFTVQIVASGFDDSLREVPC